jgi:hypothetical protein
MTTQAIPLNKQHLRSTMLALTEQELAQAEGEYERFLAAARTTRTEPVDSDDLAQARTAADLAAAFDDRFHDHHEKLALLRAIDFSPKTEVDAGAVVRSGDRHFVIAVSTRPFRCDGREFIGISTSAPIYAALRDVQEGESCAFQGMAVAIDEIY